MPNPYRTSAEFDNWVNEATLQLAEAMDEHADDWLDIVADSFEIMHEYWDGRRLLTVEVLLAKIVILYDRELRLGDGSGFNDDWRTYEWPGNPDLAFKEPELPFPE